MSVPNEPIMPPAPVPPVDSPPRDPDRVPDDQPLPEPDDQPGPMMQEARNDARGHAAAFASGELVEGLHLKPDLSTGTCPRAAAQRRPHMRLRSSDNLLIPRPGVENHPRKIPRRRGSRTRLA